MTRLQWIYLGAIIGGAIVSAPSALNAQKQTEWKNQDVSQMTRALHDLAADKKYQGTSDCRRCHDQLTDEDRRNHVGDRVCMTEAHFWADADLHADAYKSILGTLGRRIGERLSADVTKPETGCIQCHTASPAASTWANEGVNCEACHGPASKWTNLHNKYADWKKVPFDGPNGKTELGWIDVRSPITRAELCVSCHVGSVEQKRIVTHDMYAAGHPPLTGYELETSADKMPRHWRYAREKSSDGARFERTRNMLVAAVVTMRMSVELALDDVKSNRWPELARLDCFACHHELQAPGVHPVDPSIPGRAPIIVGCLPLVDVAGSISNGSPSTELAGITSDLKRPFAQNPFGDPAEIAPRGKAIVDWCRKVENQLAVMEFTPQKARQILRELASTAGKENHDYDTSRQIMDAWMICYRELTAENDSGLAADKCTLIEQSFDKINERWKHFIEPKSRLFDCNKPDSKRVYKETLEDQFKNRIDFDPQKFSSFMTKLSKQIPE